MIVLEKTVISSTEPPWTSVLWVKPVEGGVGLYVFMNGKWQLLRVMNGKGSSSPDDDEPYDLEGVGAKKLADLEDVGLADVEEGQILKYRNGTWENEEDDSGVPGPDTVGSDQIIDNSVEIRDLHDNVKDKIQKTYDISDESLAMDFDVVP